LVFRGGGERIARKEEGVAKPFYGSRRGREERLTKKAVAVFDFHGENWGKEKGGPRAYRRRGFTSITGGRMRKRNSVQQDKVRMR